MQVSTRPDFGTLVENATTEAPNHAPLLIAPDYVDGGQLYWRVAAIDADNNIGDYSPVPSSGSPARCRLRTLGSLVRKPRRAAHGHRHGLVDPIPGVP